MCVEACQAANTDPCAWGRRHAKREAAGTSCLPQQTPRSVAARMPAAPPQSVAACLPAAPPCSNHDIMPSLLCCPVCFAAPSVWLPPLSLARDAARASCHFCFASTRNCYADSR
eukprot:363402-Chlamydomonas_euryale.AAC.3